MQLVNTAPLFRPLHNELVRLLKGLRPQEWLHPTLARRWRVRDIVAHLIDTDLRRISAQRDGHHGPAPEEPIESYEQLVAFLNELNREWVRAFERLSAHALLDLVTHTGRICAEGLESVDPFSRAVYSVAWAGESESLGWMDVGRDYTEKWHHQQQIRDAVGAPLLLEDTWTKPLFELSVYCLPRVYEGEAAEIGTRVQVVIEGAGGGTWSITHRDSHWVLEKGENPDPETTVYLSPDEAWRLFYNALTAEQQAAIRIEGDKSLAQPLLTARSVMV